MLLIRHMSVLEVFHLWSIDPRLTWKAFRKKNIMKESTLTIGVRVTLQTDLAIETISMHHQLVVFEVRVETQWVGVSDQFSSLQLGLSRSISTRRALRDHKRLIWPNQISNKTRLWEIKLVLPIMHKDRKLKTEMVVSKIINNKEQTIIATPPIWITKIFIKIWIQILLLDPWAILIQHTLLIKKVTRRHQFKVAIRKITIRETSVRLMTNLVI